MLGWLRRMACLGFLLLLLLASAVARGEYGLVHVVAQNWSKDYCVLFNSDSISLPRDLRHAPLLPLHDGTSAPGCPGEDSAPQTQPSVPSQRPLHRTTAMVMKGNCSFYAKGWLAQGRGAHGLLIVSRVGSQPCSHSTLAARAPDRRLPDLTIPVAMLQHADMLDILAHARRGGGGSIRVALYAPPQPFLDYNMVVIFLLAIGTVAAGGYWAGLTEAARLQRRRARGGGGPRGPRQQAAVEGVGEAPVDFTPTMTGTVVSMSCSLMLLLYFFYDRFVYVMIAIFSLGAGTSLYSCMAPLVHYLPLHRCQGHLPGRRACTQLPLLLLAGLCTAVTAFWIAYRNENRWAWLLQDTLGIAYCLFILQRVQLPNLRNCTSFLLALLAFDVFFVFVTPLLTRTGESVMVEVASGPADSSSRERLPMVLKVPLLRFSALALCDQSFTILGFGDIVVPGFLVAYCHRFDVQMCSHQIYFRACTAAYATGLLVTFAAMVLTRMGQPALLYLVSSTLLTSLALAACRQELALFWVGPGRAKTPAQPVAGLRDAPSVGSTQEEDAADVPTAHESEGATNHSAGDLDSNLREDATRTGTVSEDEATRLASYSESSEGCSDANMDPEELSSASARASGEPQPLMPPGPAPWEPGYTHFQAKAHARDAALPRTGLHERA